MIYFWHYLQKDWGNPHCQSRLFIAKPKKRKQKEKKEKRHLWVSVFIAPGEQNLTQKTFSFLKFLLHDIMFVRIETIPI